MNEYRPPTGWNLTTLPFELTVQILCELDFPALARFRQTSSLANELVSTHSAIIHRYLAFSRRLTDELSSSAANLLLDDPCPSDTFDAQELDRVIKGNRSMSDYWVGVTNWEEYCKRRLLLDKAWREGDCIEDFIVVEEAFRENHLWRFKLDEVSKRIVATGGNGNLYSIGIEGDCDQVYPNDDECAHVEYSEGHIVLSSRILTHVVLRRADITSPPSFIKSSPPPNARYVPFAHLHPPAATTATKLRWPLFIAYAPETEEVFIWDLGKLHEANLPHSTVSVIDSVMYGDITYLDLCWDTLYVARDRGIAHIPFLTKPEATSAPLVRELEGGGTQVAIHHDCRGLLVSVSTEGQIDFESPTIGRHSLRIPGQMICELAVENGRICFIALKRWTQTLSLWLVDLNGYRSREEIFENYPVPIRLVASLPSLHPSRRLEMTGDQIFLLADADFSGSNGWLGKAFHERSRVHAESKEQKYSRMNFKEGSETYSKTRNRRWTEEKVVRSLEGYDVYDPFDDGQNAFFVVSFGRSSEGRDKFVVTK